MINFFTIFWIVINSILLLFVFSEFLLAVAAIFARLKKKNSSASIDSICLPKVCIQLPIYNEKYVVSELLSQISKMNYPADRLVIQILDDSTDDTPEVVATHLNLLRKKSGLHFEHVRRKNRDGFKAGALAFGMTLTDAEYFAVFDADFLPDPNFLQRTLPHFSDEKVGVVQSRWHHINERYSLLTSAEAVMLDAHFGVEQLGRSSTNNFINFNGTAGIWRRACIEDAGGWEGDTLTEDLDLSFRAQMRKWKIEYLIDLKSPSELPTTFHAYRNQQYRWSKGAAECVRKNMKALWNSSVGISEKVVGSLHLLNSSVYILMLLIILSGPFIFYLDMNNEHWHNQFWWVTLYGVAINLMLVLVLLIGRMLCGKTKLIDWLLFVPAVVSFFCISVGISLHMVFGVIQGYLGIKTEFVRTPKFGKNSLMKVKEKLNYGQKAAFDLRLLELVLLGYGIFWFYVGTVQLNLLTLFYSFTLIVGFSLSIFFSTRTFKIKRD